MAMSDLGTEARHRVTSVKQPINGLGVPNTVRGAAAVAFLAGPTAAYITGISLPVDGGRIESL